MKILHWLWILALTLSAAAPVSAQEWPTRPIQVVVPFPPGSVDSKARIVTEKVGKILGQPLVMVNKPGAGMLIGTEQMVRSAPDGYTIGLALQASTWISPLLDPASANYSANDMTMLGVAYDATTILVAGPKTDIHSVQDLLRVARAQPGKLNYAAPTGGSIFRIAFESLKTLTGIDVTFVPYRGLALALQDVIGGRAEVGFADTGSLPLIRAGRLRPLAVTSPERWAQLPDVPTLQELGIPLKVQPWVGFAAPRGLPPTIEKKLVAAIDEALQSTEVRAALNKDGVASVVPDTSPAAMRERIQREIAEFQKNVKPGAISFN